jgi:hypothetical protein
MSDIVDELKNIDAGGGLGYTAHDVIKRAAAEIEQLRAELAEAKAKNGFGTIANMILALHEDSFGVHHSNHTFMVDLRNEAESLAAMQEGE